MDAFGKEYHLWILADVSLSVINQNFERPDEN